MDSVGYSYEIYYQEAYDAFYAIVNRRSRTSKLVVYILLGICTVLTLVMYARQPQYIGYSLLAFLCVIMMFGIWYNPILKARKGARKVVRTKGRYQMRITKEGYLVLKDGQKIFVNGDKEARACETENVFAIRPNRAMTFCLPKRIMRENEIIFVREILEHHMKNFRTEGEFYERRTGSNKKKD